MTTICSKTCPGCGIEITYEDVGVPDNLEGALRASLIRAVNKMRDRIACDDCVQKEREGEKRKRAENRSGIARQVTYSRGWMPEDAAGATFKNSWPSYEVRSDSIAEAFQWGRNWTPKQDKNWVYAMGPAGTGKTFFARCILNHCIDKYGMTAYEVDGEQLQKWGQGWVDGDKKIADICNAGVVLIEEIGLVEWNYTGVKTLRRIIDNRWRTGKPLIVTSNLTTKEVGNQWAGAVGDKNISAYTSMKDRMRAFQILLFDGDSLRKEGHLAI